MEEDVDDAFGQFLERGVQVEAAVFGQAVEDLAAPGVGGYYGCNLACAKGAEKVELRSGPKAGKVVCIDGPEYETVGAVSCMGIFDPHFVMEYNWYCDEYGLDSISTGVTIAFFMECAERGFLSADDVGYELKFGDAEAGIDMPITAETRVADALEFVRNQYPNLPLDCRTVLITVNQEMASLERVLKANDAVSFLPYICGG